jgi:hypothetical protein
MKHIIISSFMILPKLFIKIKAIDGSSIIYLFIIMFIYNISILNTVHDIEKHMKGINNKDIKN